MTRVTLDLAQLVNEGKLTNEEAERLKGLAITSRAVSVVANVLCIFGALALALGVLAFKPDPGTGLFLSFIALGIAAYVRFRALEGWKVLGDGMAIAGTAGICGWFGLEFGDQISATMIHVIVTGIVLLSAIVFRNAFIAAFVPLGIGAIIGSGTAYWHASYGIFVREATISIFVFTAIAIALYVLLERIRAANLLAWESVVKIPARVSFFMVNFGFWVGSLWGDYVGEHFKSFDDVENRFEALKTWRETAIYISEGAFSIGWAVFLIVALLVGLNRHNRFIANTAIVFLAIHFYTQLHEYFGFNPFILLFGGIFLLTCAVGLYRFDRWQVAQANRS